MSGDGGSCISESLMHAALQDAAPLIVASSLLERQRGAPFGGNDCGRTTALRAHGGAVRSLSAFGAPYCGWARPQCGPHCGRAQSQCGQADRSAEPQCGNGKPHCGLHAPQCGLRKPQCGSADPQCGTARKRVRPQPKSGQGAAAAATACPSLERPRHSWSRTFLGGVGAGRHEQWSLAVKSMRGTVRHACASARVRSSVCRVALRCVCRHGPHSPLCGVISRVYVGSKTVTA